ncbi:MAG: GGDEF domain-containing protein [Rheinheimera sp.]
MWKQHQRKLLFSLFVLWCHLLLAFQLGDLKPGIDIDLIDILGEGTTLMVCCGWLWLILSSRPSGRVTELLYFGSLLLVYSYFLDLTDEFIQYADHIRLMSWLESFSAPIGMIVLTFGLIGWHQEQRAIDRQLRGRELFLRDHRLIDPLTQLYGHEYLHAVLPRELAMHQSEHKPLSLLVLDIDQFAAFNRQQGIAAGDHFLGQLSELLISQLRYSDVICRYSGDCFVAILPETTEAQASVLAIHLQQHVHHLGKKAEVPTVTLVAVQIQQSSALGALEQAFATLAKAKTAANLQLQPTC